jgi:hypothetical protein
MAVRRVGARSAFFSCEGYAISLASLWVVPYVSHDGANGSVEGVPRTPPSEVTLTLAAESASNINAAYSHLLFWSTAEPRVSRCGYCDMKTI